MSAQLSHENSGARLWRYTVKWKHEHSMQSSCENGTHEVFENNPTLLDEFWTSTGLTPDQPGLTPGTIVLPREGYMRRGQHKTCGKMVNDAGDDCDQLVSTMEDSENEHSRKMRRVNSTPKTNVQTRSREQSAAKDTGSGEGTSYSMPKGQERTNRQLPEGSNPVIGRSKAAESIHLTSRMASQPNTILSYNRKAGNLESYRPTSLPSIKKPFPVPPSSVQAIGASIDTINLEDTMDADTSEHEFSRIADKEASKLQSHNEYTFDAFNIQNSTTMGSDLPDYEDDEMPVRNSSPTWSVGIDDEDLYVSCPGSSQANVQVNNVDTSLPQTGPSSTMQKAPDTRLPNLLPVKPAALVATSLSGNTPNSAKISNATTYPVMLKSPSPPQRQQPGFTLILKENKLPFMIHWHDTDMNSSTDLQLLLELPPIGFYSQDDILNPDVSSNWVKKGLANLRVFQDNASKINKTRENDRNILENDLHTKKLCIITSFIHDSDDALLIFPSRSKKFAVEFTGEPVRLFGIKGVIMAYRVTIPGRAISCLQKNL